MTKLTPAQEKFLNAVAHSGKLICESYKRTTDKVAQAGYAIHINGWWTITPAGLAYLYQNEPMADQPQPAPEVEPLKVGDFVHYVNHWNQIHTATVIKVAGDTVTILTGANGLLERKTSDLTPYGSLNLK